MAETTKNMENETLNQGSKKKYLVLVVLLAVAVIGVSAYFLMSPRVADEPNLPRGEDQATVTPVSTVGAPAAPAPSVGTSPMPSTPPGADNPAIKTFTVVGSSFAFSPAEIRVKRGDRVKIVFQNSGGMHDWVIDEFSARTPIIQSGKSAEVEFVANKTGTFQYYCSVGSHRAMGMVGNLIVE